MGNTHDDVARRWHARATGSNADALKSHNLFDQGDRIMSYGSHFEVARVLRGKKGEARAFLLNGNTYSVTTSRHQSAVRSAVFGHGLPVVTIPHDALQAADIELSTIELVDVQRDWWTTRTITREDEPRRDYAYGSRSDGDMGGWVNSKTGEFFARLSWQDSKPRVECDHGIEAPGPWKLGWNYDRDQRTSKLREVHNRASHGEWEEIPMHTRRNGHFKWITGKYIEWDAVDIDGTVVWQREVQRHWLGASLIRAQVNYRVNQRHAECKGTGVSPEPWFAYDRMVQPIGPLTQEDMYRHESVYEHMHRRWERDDKSYDEPLRAWSFDGYRQHTECRGCSGRGRVISPVKRRWAYFLSGFDANESRPSYFFCELPPRVRPETVEQAFETLKPAAVRFAEDQGREVKRQGDIFAIPMPRLTLAGMKKAGGVHIKRPKLIDIDGRTVWDGPRPQLLGTNHEGTEIVTLDGYTYARGTITHNPAGRRPDHKRTPLGKEWHLILKNTVPIGV